MQHDDDGTGSGAVRLNRTQRSPRSKGHAARGNADEVSGCKRSPEREAYRKAFNPEFEITANSIVELLPDSIVTNMSIDDICRQTLYLANLVGSPYVQVH